VATVDDAARLANLLAGGTLRGNEDPDHLDGYRDALNEIVRTPGSDVFVAEVDGTVVGMGQLITFRHVQERGGRCAEIESMHVDQRLRGSGIGGLLLETMVAAARRAGCYRIQLTSNKARSEAHRFYRHHGFEATHEGFKRYL
jgi:GNAT superfamily N-acetyltransferase